MRWCALFARHPECYKVETREGHDPFGLPGLHFTRETSDSIALNHLSGGAVIIAGSGMCTGGRVRHHLRHNLGRHNCAVIFVGYAGRGTLARRIIDGAESVTLFGQEVAVRASIHTINGFSAHADQAELLSCPHCISRSRCKPPRERRSRDGIAQATPARRDRAPLGAWTLQDLYSPTKGWLKSGS
jgi:Cft2 family RNA processing exonuclease